MKYCRHLREHCMSGLSRMADQNGALTPRSANTASPWGNVGGFKPKTSANELIGQTFRAADAIVRLVRCIVCKDFTACHLLCSRT